MATKFTRIGLRTTSPFICTRAVLQPSRQSVPQLHTQILRRSASTATGAASSSAIPPTSNPTTLDWNSFLKLRKQKRRYNLAGSIVCSIITSTIGLNILGNQEIDPSKMIFGLDPLLVLGMGLIASGATGWLIGPVAGTQAFKMMNRRWLPEITKKEKEFFHHIKKNRVDPSFQSFSNPVPDYYGEKIGSLQQYRQWLKDQRAYNRKREKFL
ncbi:hypothetical protein ABW19_dt0205676 [Dactylella cylindrospora]|nr:hypothetical protein ABW19_dt0205676 [Dactylella cylindrospora]